MKSHDPTRNLIPRPTINGNASHNSVQIDANADPMKGPARSGGTAGQLEHAFFAVEAETVDLPIRDDNRLSLVGALAALDPRDREVLVMRHFDRWSTDQIAGKLGITERAVKSRLLRALLRLRGLLEPDS